jgi:flagellar biosynthesis/type III secretory pathway protein FliH
MSAETTTTAAVRHSLFCDPWEAPARATKPAFFEARRLLDLREAEVAETRAKAAAIVDAAEEAVRAITSHAEEDAARVRASAVDDAYVRGEASLLAALDALDAEIGRQRAEFDAATTRAGFDLARRVLDAELAANSAHAVAAAGKILAEADRKPRGEVVLVVRPEDADALRSAMERLRAAAPNVASIRVDAQDGRPPGDVRGELRAPATDGGRALGALTVSYVADLASLRRRLLGAAEG